MNIDLFILIISFSFYDKSLITLKIKYAYWGNMNKTTYIIIIVSIIVTYIYFYLDLRWAGFLAHAYLGVRLLRYPCDYKSNAICIDYIRLVWSKVYLCTDLHCVYTCRQRGVRNMLRRVCFVLLFNFNYPLVIRS